MDLHVWFGAGCPSWHNPLLTRRDLYLLPVLNCVNHYAVELLRKNKQWLKFVNNFKKSCISLWSFPEIRKELQLLNKHTVSEIWLKALGRGMQDALTHACTNIFLHSRERTLISSDRSRLLSPLPFPFPLSLPTFCVFVTASVKLNDTWQSGVYLQRKKIKWIKKRKEKNLPAYFTHVSVPDAWWVRASMQCSMLACCKEVWRCGAVVEANSCLRSFSLMEKHADRHGAWSLLITPWQ